MTSDLRAYVCKLDCDSFTNVGREYNSRIKVDGEVRQTRRAWGKCETCAGNVAITAKSCKTEIIDSRPKRTPASQFEREDIIVQSADHRQ